VTAAEPLRYGPQHDGIRRCGNRWQDRFRVHGREVALSFPTREEAEVCWREHHPLNGVVTAPLPRGDRRSLVSVVDEWVPTYREVAGSTHVTYARTLESYIVKPLGHLRLGECTEELLRDHFWRLRNEPRPATGKPLAATAVGRALRLMRQVFAYAVRPRYIAADPTEAISIPGVSLAEQQFAVPPSPTRCCACCRRSNAADRCRAPSATSSPTAAHASARRWRCGSATSTCAHQPAACA
jgi:hypothetical protein